MHETLRLDLNANGAGKATLHTLIKFYVTHPGFRTAVRTRLVNAWYPKGGLKRLIARLVWLRTVQNTGCFISPLAKIGPGLELRHPTGIVIGDGAVLGKNVSIYQHVTLGRRGNREGASYPTLEDNVTVYAGACIIGGITIGKGAIIGANAVVLKNIPAGATAVGNPAKVLKK